MQYSISLLLFVSLALAYCSPPPIESWPGGVIPYETYGFDEKGKKTIRRAMDAWEIGCPVRFVAAKGNEDKILSIRRVVDGTYHATVGSYDPWIKVNSAIYHNLVHEIGHSIGFKHEFQRPDRDSYVTIYWENIISSKKDNFEIVDNPLYDETLFTYDYDSVMGYNPYAFTRNGSATVTRTNGEETYRSYEPTELDHAKCREIYSNK